MVSSSLNAWFEQLLLVHQTLIGLLGPILKAKNVYSSNNQPTEEARLARIVISCLSNPRGHSPIKDVRKPYNNFTIILLLKFQESNDSSPIKKENYLFIELLTVIQIINVCYHQASKNYMYI